jgi:hypothetical protein
MLAWEHANPVVKAQIHELHGTYQNKLTFSELSLRLPLTVADAIILEQHLGLTNATEFISTVDPWCYPGEKTQAVVALKSHVQRLLEKSRNAVKNCQQYTEKSKSAFLLSPILIKERPVLIRKSQAVRGSSAPKAPPAPVASPVKKPSTRGKDYPQNMRIDFRKLDHAALQKYIDHYQLAVQAGLSNDELAVVVRVVLPDSLDSIIVCLTNVNTSHHSVPYLVVFSVIFCSCISHFNYSTGLVLSFATK